MRQRVSDERLATMAKFDGLSGLEQKLIADLQDARAEIARITDELHEIAGGRYECASGSHCGAWKKAEECLGGES